MKQGWYDIRTDALEKFENMVLRIVIITYVIFAHVIGWVLWPSGIKIDYINAWPWPWKKIWHGIKYGFDGP